MISGMYISNIWFGCVIFHTQPLNTLARKRLFLTSDGQIHILIVGDRLMRKRVRKGEDAISRLSSFFSFEHSSLLLKHVERKKKETFETSPRTHKRRSKEETHGRMREQKKDQSQEQPQQQAQTQQQPLQQQHQ